MRKIFGLLLVSIFLTGCAESLEPESNIQIQETPAGTTLEDAQYLVIWNGTEVTWIDRRLEANLRACNGLENPTWPTERTFTLKNSDLIQELESRSEWISSEIIPLISVTEDVYISEADETYRQIAGDIYAESRAINLWADGVRDFPSTWGPFADNYLERISNREGSCSAIWNLYWDYMYFDSAE